MMLHTERRPTRTAMRCRLDLAARTLMHLVADRRGWSRESAALELRARLDDDQVLHLLRARVALAMLERPTPTDRRALATLEYALRPARSPAPLAMAAGARGGWSRA